MRYSERNSETDYKKKPTRPGYGQEILSFMGFTAQEYNKGGKWVDDFKGEEMKVSKWSEESWI